jgi:hypothetical protein
MFLRICGSFESVKNWIRNSQLHKTQKWPHLRQVPKSNKFGNFASLRIYHLLLDHFYSFNTLNYPTISELMMTYLCFRLNIGFRC